MVSNLKFRAKLAAWSLALQIRHTGRGSGYDEFSLGSSNLRTPHTHPQAMQPVENFAAASRRD
jgi:hypothetical protein